MEGRPRVDGLVLAGGDSRRFGSDKRLALWRGKPLVQHALEKLARVVSGALYVATGQRGAWLPGCQRAIVLRDEPPGRGPLGGLAAALWRARTGVLVLACDLPLVSQGTLEQVMRVGLASGRPAAVRSRRGWEPLIAYYPRSLLPLVHAALDRRAAGPQELLERAGAVAVPVRSEQEVLNVNTPEDLAAAAELGARGAGR